MWNSFASNGAILAGKMLIMPMATGFFRQRNGSFANTEDALGAGGIVTLQDDDVERVRRCHRNDMEGIYLHLIISGLYTMTNPEPRLAQKLFGLYTMSRLAHTIVYCWKIRQPARGISWFVGYGIDIYITAKVITHFFKQL